MRQIMDNKKVCSATETCYSGEDPISFKGHKIMFCLKQMGSDLDIKDGHSLERAHFIS